MEYIGFYIHKFFMFVGYTLYGTDGLQQPTKDFLVCNVEIFRREVGDGTSPSKRIAW